MPSNNTVYSIQLSISSPDTLNIIPTILKIYNFLGQIVSCISYHWHWFSTSVKFNTLFLDDVSTKDYSAFKVQAIFCS